VIRCILRALRSSLPARGSHGRQQFLESQPCCDFQQQQHYVGWKGEREATASSTVQYVHSVQPTGHCFFCSQIETRGPESGEISLISEPQSQVQNALIWSMSYLCVACRVDCGSQANSVTLTTLL
jgi:hypothetical protein